MTSRRILRPLLRGVAGASGVGVAGVAFGYCTDAGFRRLVDFNRYCVPIMLHYKFVELRTRGLPDDEITAAMAPLHDMYAPRVLEIILTMEGFYIKLGQIVSTLVTSFPPIWINTLKVLQEDCPSQPFHVVKRIVEDELSAPVNQIFDSFSQTPLAAASIGQVHIARLHSGEEVVVKVQYPEAERNFNIDMDLFLRASRVLAPQFQDALKSIQRNFANEFDYVREAALQRQACEHFKEVPRVVVPRPVDAKHPARPSSHMSGLCTKSLLVMDRLQGISLQKWSTQNVQRMADKHGLSEQQMRAKLRSMSPAEIKARIPSRRALAAYDAITRSRVAIANATVFAYNWTLGWVGAPLEYVEPCRIIDIYEAADTILHAQAHSIFSAGFVNGDPHPGNIMLLKSGAVGLIDWGQVAELGMAKRCKFARLLMAVADRDELLAARYAREMGSRTEKDMDWSYAKKAFVLFGNLAEADELGGIAVFEERLNKIDKRTKLYDNMLGVVMNVTYTRQSVALLGLPELNTAVTYRQAAEECLRKAGEEVPQTVFGRCVSPRPDVKAILGI